MSENQIILLTLLSPVIFVLIAIASRFQSGFRPQLIKNLSNASTIMSMVVAAFCGYYVYKYSLIQSGLIGIKELGFSIRLDSLSVLMLGMIALLGFIIIKFSNNYLDGDQRQGAFIGRMAATIASVQLLVLSANLGLLFAAWVLTSVSLHRLLVFYPDRIGARIAAKKKFILARLGDVSLLIAVVLLYNQFGTGDLEVIFNSIKSMSFQSLEAPALFLTLAAILKSAQFPTHGWLIEIMETPTPVSALLHAGLLNAGPFLIIRMAYVTEASVIAPILLISIGGLTALFGSVVFLTQTSVKTALGYSSIAHMGFSLMVCGLGVYPAAMLHLLAHSFYKAHAFLSSGSVIETVRGAKMIQIKQSGNPVKIALSIVMAVVLYTVFALIWGLDPAKDMALFLIGAVIVMGLSRIFTTAIDGKGNLTVFSQAVFLAILVTMAFFTLESAMHYLLFTQLPELSVPAPGELLVAAVVLLLFGIVVFIQLIAPRLSNNPYYQSIAIHLRNGLYANAFFDKLVGSLKNLSEENRMPIDYRPYQSLKSEKFRIKEPEEQLV